MLKNMIILGNTNFMDVEYSEGNINLTKKRSAFKLTKKYNVDNFSKKYLTIEESMKYLKVFSDSKKYSYAVISLGEGDLMLNTDIEDFKDQFEEMIKKLAKLNVKTVLVEPSIKVIKKYNASKYQEVIIDLYKKYNTEFISYSTESENKIKNDLELKRAISRICVD